MHTSRYVRTTGALGHLLLVIVLALGVFVMHTMGHPGESSGSDMRPSAHAAPMDTSSAAQHQLDAPLTTDSGHATDPGAWPSADKPVMSMDMAALCVAVLLGAWVLAALLRAALTRRPDWLVRLLSQVAVAQRPNPPPRGPDLTQLSVLRL